MYNGTRAVEASLRIERDTTLPFASVEAVVYSSSSVPRGDYDTVLARRGTPMPAARVTLMQVDSATRANLRELGVADRLRTAFIRAAPYRADCRPIRYLDSVPWVVTGDTGFARAQLAPREFWIGEVPVFVIAAVWEYPFPRQSASIAFYGPTSRRVSASAMFDFVNTVEPGRSSRGLLTGDTSSRTRAIEWALANPVEAEGEPIRRDIRQGVLLHDMDAVRNVPSRLRGTYSVTMSHGLTRVQWVFRTRNTSMYSWGDRDSARSTASILANPHVVGTRLVGYAADSIEALSDGDPFGQRSGGRRDLPLYGCRQPTGRV